MPNCIVHGCRHRTGQKEKYPNVTLHNFPNDIHKIKNWLRQTSQYGEELDSVANAIQEVSKTGRYRMCSVHFTEDLFMTQGSKRVLKPNAVPTIFVTQPIPVSVTAMESAPYQSRKRRLVETEVVPLTSHTIVRVVRNLITIGTQTDASPVYPTPIKPTHANTRAQHRQTSLQETPKVSNLEEEQNLSLTLDESLSSIEEIDPSREGEIDTLLYEPEESFTEKDTTEKPDKIHQRRFIVFEELLDQLLYLVKCQHSTPCHAPIVEIKKKNYGTMVEINLTCLAGHCSLVWNSQPTAGQISVGNLSLACAILLSGSSFTKVEEMFNMMAIPIFSHKTFYRYQKQYIFPAIDLAWKTEQESLKKDILGQAAALAGDGQFDSPGHSAKYCTYSMMDIRMKKIVDFTIDQVGPGKNVAKIKNIALEKCLENLEQKGVDIKVLATDRHSSIRNIMKTKNYIINHQFDVWHICKSLVIKLRAASKKRKCKDIAQWIGPITNHLWWCAQTCDQNVENLLDKWRSLLYHIANKHTFKNLKTYKSCQHKQLPAEESRDRKWITPSHPAYSTLVGILNSPLLIKDISKIEKFCHTRDLENFHSKILKYRPKKISFNIDSMYARTMLAVLSHNKTVNRPQVTICSKKHKLFVGEKKNYSGISQGKEGKPTHLLNIISDAEKIVKGELVHRWESRTGGYLPILRQNKDLKN
eukprot:XP_012822337.1 PREDICTED: uncharacterized protein LOC100494649 [Xenopus tropicalis]